MRQGGVATSFTPQIDAANGVSHRHHQDERSGRGRRARACWRRCSSTPSARAARSSTPVEWRARPRWSGVAPVQSGHRDGAVGASEPRVRDSRARGFEDRDEISLRHAAIERKRVGPRLHVHRAAGRHRHSARPRVGGDAARPGLGAASERGGAAPLPARNAAGGRQVQGCRRCRRHRAIDIKAGSEGHPADLERWSKA